MPRHSRIALIGAGLLALGVGVSVSAQQAGPPPGASGRPGKALMENRADLKAMLEKRFDEMDANHDGTLTPQERQAQHEAARAKAREAMFARLDTDKNGSISKAEFDAGHQMGPGRPPMGRMGDMGGMDRMHRMGDGPMPGHSPEAGGPPPQGPMAAMKDKSITKAQFVEAGLARFDRVDTDHDGKISSAERDAARKAMRDRLAPAHRPPPPPPGL